MTINTGAYVGAKSCTSGPQPGVWGAMDYFLSAYKSKGGVNTGIYNCRSVRGGRTTSLHGEGRAADFGIRPYSAGYGTALAKALVAYSKELGIQCVIWNRGIWSSSYPHSGFRRYNGVASHTDHIHVEFTWARAKAGRAETAKHFAKVLGGVKPGDVKIGGGTSGGSSKKYESAKANHEVGSRVMRKYTGGSDVYWLQRRLYKLGYDIDPAFDRLFGPNVEKQVKAFQGDAKIAADGEVYTETIKSLRAAKVKRQLPSKPKPKPGTNAPKFPYGKYHYIGRESNSPYSHSGALAKDRPHVRKWQQRMKDRGWNIAVDGYFGAGSERVARQFQKQIGVLVDGKVGKVTFAKSWTAPIT